jgi:hypothetical protein
MGDIKWLESNDIRDSARGRRRWNHRLYRLEKH